MTEILPPRKIDSAQPSEPSDAAARLTKLWLQSDGLGDRWEDADLPRVARYLFGARGLNIPKQWEWLFPSNF